MHTTGHAQSLSGGLSPYINAHNGARQLGGPSKRCGVGAPAEPPTCRSHQNDGWDTHMFNDVHMYRQFPTCVPEDRAVIRAIRKGGTDRDKAGPVLN